MAKKKKTKRRKFADTLMVSNQKWEIQYIASKFGIYPEQVRDAKKAIGRSRRKLYAYIRENID